MTHEERLESCKKCLNRKLDPEHRFICKLTGQAATFEGACKDFQVDEKVLTRMIPEDAGDEVMTDIPIVIEPEVLDKLQAQQDISLAIVGGLISAVASAVLWAVITVATEYQIGYMAIAVGLIVGFSVQFFGLGIDKIFGVIGAGFALLGCMLGNLFSQVGFIADSQGYGYFETLTYLNYELVFQIMIESFSAMDILFYGIAGYEGFKFAFRKITEETIQEINLNNSAGYPAKYKLRMPLAIGSFVLLSLGFFMLKQGYSGEKIYYYETGEKLSEGELKNNKEHGLWTYYYESGRKRSTGFYKDGVADSMWRWYDEYGVLIKSGFYKKDLEHGVWMAYYSNGVVSDSGAYHEGRMTGKWKSYYENGQLFQEGDYHRNYPEGLWLTYYDNGQKSSVGRMKEGEPAGKWKNYYKNGQLSDEITYNSEGEMIINNVWDLNGSQIIKDGSGYYETFFENGNLMAAGELDNGRRTGIWKMYYEKGNLKEEGEYEGNIFRVTNSWSPDGEKQVRDGNGIYMGYYPDGILIMETGENL